MMRKSNLRSDQKINVNLSEGASLHACCLYAFAYKYHETTLRIIRNVGDAVQ